MLIAHKELLDEFVQTHASAVKPLNTWVERVKEAQWKFHSDLKLMFPSADYVKMAVMCLILLATTFA